MFIFKCRHWLWLAAAILFVPFSFAQAVDIYPGTDIQTVVDANAPGAAFVLKTGVHRLQAIRPKDGQRFTGEPGTILSGAKVLTGFIPSGSGWVASGQTQESPPTALIPGYDMCRPGFPRCTYNEELFIDNTYILPVAGLAQGGPGKWFFDYPNDKIYIWDNPAGRTVETSVMDYAFGGGAAGVTVEKLIIEKYRNTAQSGAIAATGGQWVVQDNEVRWNHGIGIHTAPGMKILRNTVHHMGQMGMGGGGDAMLVEGNTIAYNNVAGFDSYWEAGATKFVATNNLIVRNNYVHHNKGPGLWTDINNNNTLYEGNRVESNEEAGIGHEISYKAIIRNNIVLNNGTRKPYPYYVEGAGIVVSNSPDVEIYGNIVYDNWQAITAIQNNPPRGAGLSNLYVHDNIISAMNPLGGGSGRTGVGGANINNRFEHNTYYLGSYSTYFFWNEQEINETQWQAAGNDLTGTFYHGRTPPAVGSGCDVNSDGSLNINDVQLCVNQAISLAPCTADVNGDGQCNVADVQLVINAVIGLGCPAKP